MTSIIIADSTKDLKQFLAVQRRIYDRCSPAQPLPEFEVRRLLDGQRNPTLRGRGLFLLLALHNGEPVGRCSLVLPRQAGGSAIFGFFECIDEQHAAHVLLERAEELCREHGASALHGPFSPTYSGITGVQLDCFGERNLLNEACSPPYYSALLESAGYAIERRGRTWRNIALQKNAETLSTSLPARGSRYHIRQVGLNELAKGIEDLAEVFEAAFSQGWSREPMSLDEYFYNAEFLLPAFRPESFSLVCDGSRPVGALLCFPDINPALHRLARLGRLPATLAARLGARISRSLITFAIGIHPDYQNSGVSVLLSKHLAQMTRRYTELYSTWITEGNTASERMAVRFGLVPWKTFAVYRKDI